MPNAKPLSQAAIDDINYQYLPRMSVDDADAYLLRARRRSDKARRELECLLDVSYGDSPRQVLDIFPGPHSRSPVLMFIHGGYWRAADIDRGHYSYIAKAFVAQGATVVLPEYDLCPAVRITDIVEQMRKALAWIYRRIGRYNGDKAKIFVSGHSAGGHLTAMMVATDWTIQAGLPNNLIKGSAPLSGLFDIEPHRHSQLQGDIRLTAKEAKAMSPIHFSPVSKAPAIVAVGEREPDLFHWQSLQYAANLRHHRVAAEYISTQDDHHFSITDRMGRRNDPLARKVMDLMGIG